jgi:CBS domain containing-hemolysin-like protein
MEHGAPAFSLSIPWALALTGLFLLANAFFVAAEFALVKVRTARMEGLARKGSRPARAVLVALERLDLYLSGCQLGITLASLVLGWLAEPAVAGLIIAGAERVGLHLGDSGPLHLLALAIALSVVTILHMTIGEQAPKIWAIQRSDSAALLIAPPLRLFVTVLRPVIWFINSLSNALLRLAGVPAGLGHEVADVEELLALLRGAAKAGHISARQRSIGENVLTMASLEVRHVMVPRVDVVFLSSNQAPAEQLEIIRRSGHTRLPLCGPDLDQLEGLVHGKDVLGALLGGDGQPDLRALVRPLMAVPDHQPLTRLIRALQRAQTHCAAVVDEHGTTLGLVFLEDALEEIVGPLHDEFDAEVERWARAEPGVFELAGSVPVPEAAELLEIELEQSADTIAGVIIDRLGSIPSEGDQIELPPYRVTVLSVLRRRVARLRFERQDGAEARDEVAQGAESTGSGVVAKPST